MKQITKDGRQEIYDGNKLVGYVEDDKLYAILANGYAKHIADVDPRDNFVSILEQWRNNPT